MLWDGRRLPLSQPQSVAPFETDHEARAAAAIVEWFHFEHRSQSTRDGINDAVFYGMADEYALKVLLDAMTQRGMIEQSSFYVYELTDLGAAWFIWGIT